MVFTEIRNIKGKRYYYRVISIRKGNKISKKRLYLGFGLSDSELLKKEKKADEVLLSKKIKKGSKEIDKIKQKIIDIFKKYKIKKAGIFGSYVRGENREESDIDILIDIRDKKMSLLGFVGIKLDLQEALKRKVDLVEYKMIRPELKKQILKEEVRII